MKAGIFITATAAAAIAFPLAASGQAGSAPPAFQDLDRDRSGAVSRTEWLDYYASSASGSATAGGTGGMRDNPATVDRTPASSTTGTTAGPGAASERTGSGSATATQPSTSGHGKAR